jgi:hypothetical protein
VKNFKTDRIETDYRHYVDLVNERDALKDAMEKIASGVLTAEGAIDVAQEALAAGPKNPYE